MARKQKEGGNTGLSQSALYIAFALFVTVGNYMYYHSKSIDHMPSQRKEHGAGFPHHLHMHDPLHRHSGNGLGQIHHHAMSRDPTHRHSGDHDPSHHAGISAFPHGGHVGSHMDAIHGIHHHIHHTDAQAPEAQPVAGDSPPFQTVPNTASKFWSPASSSPAPKAGNPGAQVKSCIVQTDKQPRPLNAPPPLACGDAGTDQELCAALTATTLDKDVMLVAVEAKEVGGVKSFLSELSKQGVSNALVVAADASAAKELQEAAIPHYYRTTPVGVEAAGVWGVARDVVALGYGALLARPDVTFAANPFAHLGRDADVEVVAPDLGDRETRGRVVGVDDAAMGWSRFAQTMSVGMAEPGLLYLGPTAQALELARAVSGYGLGWEEVGEGLAAFLSRQLFMPAHDQYTRFGGSVRVLDSACFGRKDGLVASLAGSSSLLDKVQGLLRGAASAPGALKATPNNAIIASSEFTDGRKRALQHGCAPLPAQGPAPRPLNYVVGLDEEWPPRAKCAELGLEGLCDTIEKHAIGRDILVAVSNKNIFHMLELFIKGVHAAGVPNAMIVALDQATGDFVQQHDFPFWVRVLKAKGGATDNHATSGLKFQILRDFISIGCNVLLSDVDIVFLEDPFKHLYRDTDIEGMTDGWDDPTAYGWDWVSASGGGGTHREAGPFHNIRRGALNSGLFYIQATHQTYDMMNRLAWRMANEGVWDQTAYNEEQFYVSHKRYVTPGVSSRAMNYLCFQNSKVLFRYVVEDPELYAALRPVSVHINYHPEKPQRMVDVHAQYHEGVKDAILKWNPGEGLKIQSTCKKQLTGEASRNKIAASDVGVKMSGHRARWGIGGEVEFQEDGKLSTPWGLGKWGALEGDRGFYAEFIKTDHMLVPAESGWPKMKSIRCSDGEEVEVVFE